MGKREVGVYRGYVDRVLRVDEACIKLTHRRRRIEPKLIHDETDVLLVVTDNITSTIQLTQQLEIAHVEIITQRRHLERLTQALQGLERLPARQRFIRVDRK